MFMLKWMRRAAVGEYRVRQVMKALLLVPKRPGHYRYPRGGKWMLHFESPDFG